MESDQLLTIFLANTLTKDSAQHRLSLTKEFLEYYFFTKHENQNLIYLLNKFINEKKENRDEFNALFTWGYHFFDLFTKKNMYNLLTELENRVRDLPTAVVYLPFVLPVYALPKLSAWFRTNVHPNFIIDLKSDRDLIGGCAIVWKGTYHDFSLRYFLSIKKAAVKKIVDDFLPPDQHSRPLDSPSKAV